MQAKNIEILPLAGSAEFTAPNQSLIWMDIPHLYLWAFRVCTKIICVKEEEQLWCEMNVPGPPLRRR